MITIVTSVVVTLSEAASPKNLEMKIVLNVAMVSKSRRSYNMWHMP